MIASADLIGTALGIFGSLIQARYISPDDLGFVRKYSVVSGYAVFLTLGLFTILQREYPVLVGRGELDKARRVAAIGQSWSLLVCGVVCGGLAIVCLSQVIEGDWREASAWFIQIVSVWATIYGGYLICTFRSGQEFEHIAKSSLFASISGVLVLPLFTVLPFTAMVLRSVTGSLVSSLYQHVVRPVKVGWCLPFGELLALVKRGLRLFAGSYLRYQFWTTVEIWLMLRFAGDMGVGLFTFSSMIVIAVGQLSNAVNQIYMPRLAHLFGKCGDLGECLRMSVRPTMVNVLSATLFSGVAWLVLPPVITHAFPKYIPAIPLLGVLLLDTIVVAMSLPIYMVTVLEDYTTQFVAAVAGLAVLVAVTLFLGSLGYREISVVWGTIAGRVVFGAVSLLSLIIRWRRSGKQLIT
jgi:O-antigen/teichoic acid export membrane protein